MTHDGPSRATPHWAWAWGGLLLTVLGPFVYSASLEYPMLRATGLPAWLFMGAGLVVCIQSARTARRRAPWVLTGVSATLLAAFVYIFFVLAAVPESSAAELSQAPDFTLSDHSGKPFTLSEERAKGPILLVFYRGHW